MTQRHHMSIQGDMFHERYISLVYHISADSNFRSAIIFRYSEMRKKKLHLKISYFNLMILKMILGIVCDLYVHIPAERIKRAQNWRTDTKKRSEPTKVKKWKVKTFIHVRRFSLSISLSLCLYLSISVSDSATLSLCLSFDMTWTWWREELVAFLCMLCCREVNICWLSYCCGCNDGTEGIKWLDGKTNRLCRTYG